MQNLERVEGACGSSWLQIDDLMFHQHRSNTLIYQVLLRDALIILTFLYIY